MQSEFKIRLYHPSDLTALYQVCLKTGNNGSDASSRYIDGDLLGHVYVAPYVTFEPGLCFVLLHHGKPSGYVLGTSDSQVFRDWCEKEWFPPLRERYPLPGEYDQSPDAWVVRSIHQGMGIYEGLDEYPSHLHIDILPEGQGLGWGRKLIQFFLDKLFEQGSTGVYLGVSKANQGAVAFYARVGFQILRESEGGIIYGIRLSN